MKLSIITINYNNAQGLYETMVSVLAQKNMFFEYIVVDGNSKDDSIDRIKLLEKDFQNCNLPFKWISEPDKGIFHAMNKGIKISQGEYLLFLNSGDTFTDKTVINDVFEIDRDHDIICGKALLIKNGEIVGTSKYPDKFTFNFFFLSTIAHQATFIRKNLFDKYGYYREDLRLKGDWEFWLRCIIFGEATVQIISRKICYYDWNGLSSKPENRFLQEQEKQKIYSENKLNLIIPDYENAKRYCEKRNEMYWLYKRPIFIKILRRIYKTVLFLKQNRIKKT